MVKKMYQKSINRLGKKQKGGFFRIGHAIAKQARKEQRGGKQKVKKQKKQRGGMFFTRKELNYAFGKQKKQRGGMTVMREGKKHTLAGRPANECSIM